MTSCPTCHQPATTRYGFDRRAASASPAVPAIGCRTANLGPAHAGPLDDVVETTSSWSNESHLVRLFREFAASNNRDRPSFALPHAGTAVFNDSLAFSGREARSNPICHPPVGRQ